MYLCFKTDNEKTFGAQEELQVRPPHALEPFLKSAEEGHSPLNLQMMAVLTNSPHFNAEGKPNAAEGISSRCSTTKVGPEKTLGLGLHVPISLDFSASVNDRLLEEEGSSAPDDLLFPPRSPDPI